MTNNRICVIFIYKELYIPILYMINPNIFQAMIMDKNRDIMAQPTSLDIWMYLIHITKIVGVQWINLGNSR